MVDFSTFFCYNIFRRLKIKTNKKEGTRWLLHQTQKTKKRQKL